MFPTLVRLLVGDERDATDVTAPVTQLAMRTVDSAPEAGQTPQRSVG